jgi:hypothetical protein
VQVKVIVTKAIRSFTQTFLGNSDTLPFQSKFFLSYHQSSNSSTLHSSDDSYTTSDSRSLEVNLGESHAFKK